MPEQLVPGDEFGPYRVVRQLGAGGMGIVYEALDTSLGRSVALKVISGAYAADPGFRRRFVREARAQASLDSPHVVQVFSHGQHGGRLYIASQLIPDGDLGQMLRRHGPPTLDAAVELIAQVADGLAEAHRIGLVHRDIKPANVLLRNRGTDLVAYLADFGIARHLGAPESMAIDGAVAGTPNYLAPEIAAGAPASQAGDIYALGCLLWAALTGRPPYTGSNDTEVMALHATAPIPQLPGGTPKEREVNRILMAALAKRPEHRFPSAASLRDALRSVRTTPAPPSRKPLLVAGLVAGLVAVAGGILAVVLLAGGDDSGRQGDRGGDDTSTAPELSREERAVASITKAFEAEGVEPEQAQCTAEKIVDKRGVDGLQEAGYLDDDLEYVDGVTVGDSPGVGLDLIAAAASCGWDAARS